MHRVGKLHCTFLIIIAAMTFGLAACATSPTTASTTTPTPTVTPTSTPTPGGPGGGAIINSDSVVTVTIQAVRPQTSGYPWELDVLVESSVNVDSLPNPTANSTGKVITVKTDQDITSFKVGDSVTARVKYVGDVPKPGITLYMYSIAPLIHP